MGKRCFPAWGLILFPACPGFFPWRSGYCRRWLKSRCCPDRKLGCSWIICSASRVGESSQTRHFRWSCWEWVLSTLAYVSQRYPFTYLCFSYDSVLHGEMGFCFAANFFIWKRNHLFVKIIPNEGQWLYLFVSVWFNLNPWRCIYCIYSLSFVFWISISEATWRCAGILMPSIHTVLTVLLFLLVHPEPDIPLCSLFKPVLMLIAQACTAWGKQWYKAAYAEEVLVLT